VILNVLWITFSRVLLCFKITFGLDFRLRGNDEIEILYLLFDCENNAKQAINENDKKCR
jgi:hypothetical protein